MGGVKFYNMEVEVDHNLMTCHDGLYVIGDGSSITHSLSTHLPVVSMWQDRLQS